MSHISSYASLAQVVIGSILVPLSSYAAVTSDFNATLILASTNGTSGLTSNIDNLLDRILNVDDFVSNPAVATWLAHLWVKIAQGIIIMVSLIDFTIFTGLLLYGTVLAIKATRGWEKMFPMLVAVFFLVFRFLYLPFLMLLIPIKHVWQFPKIVFKITFVSLFLLYAIVFIITIIIASHWAVKYRIWRNSGRREDKVLKRARFRVRKRIRHNRIPQIIVVMPIYNEDPEALVTAVKSVVDSIYPTARITVFLSFDNDEESSLFLYLMKYLTQSANEQPGQFTNRTVVYYKGVQFVVNRFPHGGKRGTQSRTFQQIKEMYSIVEEHTFVLFIDSDIILYPDCMIEFVRAMEKGKNLIGMTGFISAISSRERNILLYCQDCEYLTSQVFWRSLEASLGGVTCLPGALTILRLKELTKAAETYFSDLKTDQIFDFHRYHLGEDRYLTHLLMEQSQSYSIGFCPSARAKTEAPGTWTSFLKQRRRWLLGAFANEIYFLSDYRLWLRTPLLLLFKFYDFTARSASAFFIYIVVIQLSSGSNYNPIQLVILFGPVFVNWLMLLVFALVLRRFKVFFMFPVMIIVTAWANFFVNVYSIWTWNVRTWGGPRATEAMTLVEVKSPTVSDTATLDDGRESPDTHTSSISASNNYTEAPPPTPPKQGSESAMSNTTKAVLPPITPWAHTNALSNNMSVINDIDKPLPPIMFLPPLSGFHALNVSTSSTYSSDWDTSDLESDDMDSDTEGGGSHKSFSGFANDSPKFQIYREPLGLSASAVRGSPRFGGGNTNGGGLVSAGSSSSLHIVTLPSAVSTAESIDTVNESDVGLVVNMDDNHNDVETGTTHAMATSRLATTTPSGGHQRVASPYIPSNLHP
ncbi:hypothetical protein BASA50_002477 [Batrachochytrium salamandrivorans]|uniref:chitin synthase n=1 Tax=Batrachochytrium salamandrivorans TaxID=1357716 RepID=A0ABQ8FL75_9FUNG|nr:hypothetical protein BASA50_002477 [Batrachochytrium salamandrivorans]KAH9250699.1 hypothetical protein BASA81_011482 [Batrachochytrium salamandrivorans]